MLRISTSLVFVGQRQRSKSFCVYISKHIKNKLVILLPKSLLPFGKLLAFSKGGSGLGPSAK